MFFWCCGRKDELDREDDGVEAFDTERLISGAEEALGGAKDAIAAKAQDVEAGISQDEHMIANPAAAWTPSGQQASVADTGKENHQPSIQEASVKAVTSEAREIDLPVVPKPEEPVPAKQPAEPVEPVEPTQVMDDVVTGTPVAASKSVSQTAESPSTPGQGDSIVNEIAAAATGVQETAKAAAAAANSQKDSEASTSAGAASPTPAVGTPSPSKKGGSKKKKGKGKGKKK